MDQVEGMNIEAKPSVPSEADVVARVEALLERMSLEEKIGQLTQIGGAAFVPGPKPEEVIRKGGAGSVLWLNDTKKFNALQKIAVEESPSKIPLLFALDVIHGYRTIFPVPLAMASSWDPSVAERAQAVAAREARAAGLHWTFGPMLDIARDARWGRIVEGAGEDPFLGAAMAAAQVRGFQGAVSRCARSCRGLRQTLRRVRRGGRRARLRSGLPARRPAAQRLLPALRGRSEGRRWDVYERLHGPQRCPCEREPLPAARCPAGRMGLPGLRRQRRVCRRKPGHPGLRPRWARCGLPRAECRPRHGHGQQHLSAAPRRACRGWHTKDGRYRRGRAAHSRDQGPHGTLRAALRRRVEAGSRLSHCPSTARKRGSPPSARWCCCGTKAGSCRLPRA